MARDDTARDPPENRSSVNRRSYLKLAGVAASSATALMAGTASAATERHGITFDTEVNMVEDAGCDPNGDRAADDAINSAAASNTLLRFPEGTYRITQPHVFSGLTNFGIVGDGDVTFEVPRNYTEHILAVTDGRNILFEGVEIDQRANGSDAHLKFVVSDGLRVQDVTVRGFTPTLGLDTFRMIPIVTDSNGTAVIENFSAPDGAEPGVYKNGSGGLYAGPSNRGTIRLVDCHVEGFSNNGVYMGRSGGPVQVEGGTYKNNDVSQLRLSGSESYIEGTTIVVDDPGDMRNTRGVWWDGAKIDKTGGEIRDCDIHIADTPNSAGAIRIWGTAGACDITNTRIRVDVDGVPAVRAEPPTGDMFSPPPRPHRIVMDGVHVTGDAASGDAVRINRRPNSVVRNSCIQQPGSSRGGVTLVDADDSAVEDSTINVSGQAVDLQNSSTDVSNISESGTCKVPSDDSSDGGDGGSGGDNPDDGDSGSDDPDDGDSGDNSDDETTTPSLDATITVESDGGGVATYEFTVSEAVERNPDAMEDTVEGATASGRVGPDSGIDSFQYAGEITEFSLDGPATVYRNGTEVDPSSLVSNGEEEEALPNSIVIDGGDHPNVPTTYSFGASGEVEKSAELGTINAFDSISDEAVSGRVIAGKDAFRFSGSITHFKLDGSATVTFDGES